MSAKVRPFLLFVLLFVLSAFPLTTQANHSWGNYHWARTSNPFTLKMGDNVSSAWDSYLQTASVDWSKSSVLDTVIVAGGTRPRNCRPTAGRIEVCNATYGNTGWLGVAQIWASGNHITQATTKVNDTYFNTAQYNTPAWRNLVMCQEIGHDFGLDHQDENFNNPPLGTCMDYSNDPNPNQHPNAHDYQQLETIYSHVDNTSTVFSAAPREFLRARLDSPSQWGTLVRQAGQQSLYVRDFGGGHKVFTFVFWVGGNRSHVH